MVIELNNAHCNFLDCQPRRRGSYKNSWQFQIYNSCSSNCATSQRICSLMALCRSHTRLLINIHSSIHVFSLLIAFFVHLFIHSLGTFDHIHVGGLLSRCSEGKGILKFITQTLNEMTP